MVAEALQRTGQRGILLTGYGAVDKRDLPDTIFCADSIPHRILFPYMRAVVHHGGLNTTAEGLRAGKPTIITPVYGEQFLWHKRVMDLELGPETPPFRALNADKLSEAIDAVVTDERYARNARSLGDAISGENGVKQAVKFFESYMRQEYQASSTRNSAGKNSRFQMLPINGNIPRAGSR